MMKFKPESPATRKLNKLFKSPSPLKSDKIEAPLNMKGNENLLSKIKPFLSNMNICDLMFVCIDGKVASSSLVLATLSPFFKSILDSVPVIDKMKTIVIPDITCVQVILLNTVPLTDQTIHLDRKDKQLVSHDALSSHPI